MKNTTVLFVHIVALTNMEIYAPGRELGNLFYIIIDIIF